MHIIILVAVVNIGFVNDLYVVNETVGSINVCVEITNPPPSEPLRMSIALRMFSELDSELENGSGAAGKKSY